MEKNKKFYAALSIVLVMLIVVGTSLGYVIGTTHSNKCNEEKIIINYLDVPDINDLRFASIDVDTPTRSFDFRNFISEDGVLENTTKISFPVWINNSDDISASNLEVFFGYDSEELLILNAELAVFYPLNHMRWKLLDGRLSGSVYLGDLTPSESLYILIEFTLKEGYQSIDGFFTIGFSIEYGRVYYDYLNPSKNTRQYCYPFGIFI